MASDQFARWLKRQLRPSWVAETELRLQFRNHRILEYAFIESSREFSESRRMAMRGLNGD